MCLISVSLSACLSVAGMTEESLSLLRGFFVYLSPSDIFISRNMSIFNFPSFHLSIHPSVYLRPSVHLWPPNVIKVRYANFLKVFVVSLRKEFQLKQPQ